MNNGKSCNTLDDAKAEFKRNIIEQKKSVISHKNKYSNVCVYALNDLAMNCITKTKVREKEKENLKYKQKYRKTYPKFKLKKCKNLSIQKNK